MESKILNGFNCDIETGIALEDNQFYSNLIIKSDGENFNSCEIDICSFGITEEIAKDRLKEHIKTIIEQLENHLESI